MEDMNLLQQTRRHFFGQCGLSLGSMSLLSLLGEAAPRATPRTAGPGHHPARARSVIYVFMAGGPSQLELFDNKPGLQQRHGQVVPQSLVQNRRFAFIPRDSKLLGTRRRFRRHGQSGAEISELLPHLAGIADDIAIVRSARTEAINHGPAKLFINTGSSRPGRPSMGAWVTYGIGSESRDLPGFVVLQTGRRGIRGGASLYSNGFLPPAHQGVALRSTGDPILDLTSPAGINPRRQGQAIEAINALNLRRLAATGDPEIAARIAAYEMAFRMQTSGPELVDLRSESRATLALYGAEPDQPSFARNCLLARRLVERGVRFVQLYHTDWDHHGGPGGNDIENGIEARCRETDQACAALVRDLKARGLLDSTLVVWGGEFGRTPMGEDKTPVGRDHHRDAFTIWLAGGGIKPGITFGSTDEFGFSIADNPVDVHDLQATILHLLGLDHTRLTYRFQGRDFRLTDVAGTVVRGLLA
ncbi:MAG: DUF1501 domain-containing protein [Planctomycetes bacterium]|nr:DUF1501 domain-containing protein [Planctomycetota bacterium]